MASGLLGTLGMKTGTILLLTASLVVPTLSGCGLPDDDAGCAEGKCDEDIPDSPCDGIIVDESGHEFKKIGGRNGDALAKLLFRDGECPTTMPAMMQKLREVDKDGCSGELDGVKSRFVSETAQALGRAPQSYRGVTSRACGGRNAESIMFSHFIGPDATEAPQSSEIMSFDEVAGVFNYYEVGDDKISFFGSSKDFLADEGGRCKSCHTYGEGIMKELDSPWLNWGGHEAVFGADVVINKVKDLGRPADGIEFEGTIIRANDKYNAFRIKHLKEQNEGKNVTKGLLTPLFCTKQINIGNGAAFKSPLGGGPGGDEIRSIPFKAFIDPQLKSFGGFSIQFTDYDTQIKANGQKVNGLPGAIDTLFDFAFPMRARSDVDYIEKLVEGGIIDDDFVKDALMVDFTRSLFSTDRCALLDFAPELSADNVNPTAIRDGFIANLEAESPVEGSPAAVFLAHLKATGDATAHAAKVDAFAAACNALGSRTFVDRALQVTSANRNAAREMPVIEFPQAFPVDNLDAAVGSRLSPVDCSVTTRFVAP